MTDRHPIDDPELDAVPADAEDEEEAGLYEHFAVTADKGQTPMRLDKFLTVRMEHCSRNRIQAAADSGNILVNGKAAKSSYKVKPLDRIQIVMPYPRREVELVAEDIPLDIPYEDQWLLLVDKPAGLVVHPGVGNYSGTLVNALMHHLNKQGIPAEEQNRAGLVHRIDKNTSGLLVIAKDEQTHARLAKQFFDHTIQRRYVALVWGNFDEDEGTITGNIGRSPKDRQKMFVFADGSDGKHAVTHWKVLKRYGYVTHPPDPRPHGVDRAPAVQRRTLRRRPHPQGHDLRQIPAVHRKLLRGDAAPRAARPPAGLRTPRNARKRAVRKPASGRFPVPADKMEYLHFSGKRNQRKLIAAFRSRCDKPLPREGFGVGSDLQTRQSREQHRLQEMQPKQNK